MRHIHAPFLFASILFTLAAAGCSASVASPSPVQSVVQGDSPCDPTSKECPPPDPGACSVATIGDGVDCQPYADLKTQATNACIALGSVLVDIDLDPQGCPDGEVPAAQYTCCLPATPSGPSPCTGGAVGDGVTCVDEAVLHDEASALCAEGASLTYFETSAAGCDGTVNLAKYLCCAP